MPPLLFLWLVETFLGDKTGHSVFAKALLVYLIASRFRVYAPQNPDAATLLQFFPTGDRFADATQQWSRYREAAVQL